MIDIKRLWLSWPLLFYLGWSTQLSGQVEFQTPTWKRIRSEFETGNNSGRESLSVPVNPGAYTESQGSARQDLPQNSGPIGFASQSRSGNETGPDRRNGTASAFSARDLSRGPEPIITRQKVFGVPFSVNPEAGPIREVQLHVSADLGKTWQLYGRQLPTATEFPFRATADGEYWFAVRTVGTTLSSNKLKPELVIRIDSSRPSLIATVKTDTQGRLVVSWRAADESLEPESIQLVYQTVGAWGRGAGPWQKVRLPAVPKNVGNVYEDEVAFFPETNNVSLDLRISIADKAGNVTIVNRRYNLPRSAGNRIVPRNQINVAERTSRPGSSAARPDSARPPSTDPFSHITQAEKDDAASRIGLTSDFESDRTDRNAGVESSAWRKDGWHVQGNSAFAQDFHSNRPDATELSSGGDTVPGSISDPGFQNPNRLASSSRNLDDSAQDYARGSRINRIPDGQYAKLSSSRKFELEYQVDHLQAQDISRLEIWVTRDAGKTWKLETVDQDRQSPVVIEVDEDGVYGYRIRIQTVDGLESALPQTGDAADVWVEVDTTRPSVELTSIPYGRRSDAGKLIINWRATDRRLAIKPITLYYSVNLDGPWQIIVEKLPNSGQFKWPVTDRIPRSVYIRIEALDAAGNRNFHQTDQPIDLSGLNPRGMIRAVRPIK